MDTKQRTNDRRSRGFLLFETLIALAFLAVAAGLTLKMHQAGLDFDRVSMDRLSNQLTLENAAEQLTGIPFSEVPDAAARLEEEFDVQMKVDRFQSGSSQGWHLQISIESESGPLTRHFWRLEATS